MKNVKITIEFEGQKGKMNMIVDGITLAEGTIEREGGVVHGPESNIEDEESLNEEEQDALQEILWRAMDLSYQMEEDYDD